MGTGCSGVVSLGLGSGVRGAALGAGADDWRRGCAAGLAGPPHELVVGGRLDVLPDAEHPRHLAPNLAGRKLCRERRLAHPGPADGMAGFSLLARSAGRGLGDVAVAGPHGSAGLDWD